MFLSGPDVEDDDLLGSVLHSTGDAAEETLRMRTARMPSRRRKRSQMN